MHCTISYSPTGVLAAATSTTASPPVFIVSPKSGCFCWFTRNPTQYQSLLGPPLDPRFIPSARVLIGYTARSPALPREPGSSAGHMADKAEGAGLFKAENDVVVYCVETRGCVTLTDSCRGRAAVLASSSEYTTDSQYVCKVPYYHSLRIKQS